MILSTEDRERVNEYSRMEKENVSESQEVPLSLINSKSENFRVDMDGGGLSEMMASIQSVGVLQPIGLTLGKNNKFDIVWGNRRFNAVRKLKKHSILARFVYPKDRTEFLTMHLQENVIRAPLQVSEIGRAAVALLEEGNTLSEAAVVMGRSVVNLKNAIEVYKEIPEDFRSAVIATGAGGGKRARGRIPLSLTAKILTAKKNGKLTAEESKKMFTYAKQDHKKVTADFKGYIEKSRGKDGAVDPENAIHLTQVSIRFSEKTRKHLMRVYIKTGVAKNISELFRKIIRGEVAAKIPLLK